MISSLFYYNTSLPIFTKYPSCIAANVETEQVRMHSTASAWYGKHSIASVIGMKNNNIPVDLFIIVCSDKNLWCSTYPDINVVIGEGSDKERWLGLSRADKQAEIMKLVNSPSKEVVVTQELRQKDFDNGKTTDDHGMHIYGLAKDQNGTKYFMVKNSWGESGKYKGHWYASESFVMHKTLNIIVHKNAIPKDIRKKLGIK